MMKTSFVQRPVLKVGKGAFFVLLLSGLLTSCMTLTPTSLSQSPQTYFQKEVTIGGRVSALVQIPFTDLRVFLLSDDHNSVPVVSLKAPRTDIPVTLKVWVAGFAVPLDKLSQGDQQTLKHKLQELGLIKEDASDMLAGILITTLRGLGSASQRVYFLVERG